MADLSQFGGMWLNREDGASEGIRTLDTHVGNVMLYQAELRSLPSRLGQTTGIRYKCKGLFWGFWGFWPTIRRVSGLNPTPRFLSLGAREWQLANTHGRQR